MLRILEDVVRWGLESSPPAAVIDVVVQDELSHDVVVRWGHLHLVFDTTCMGGLNRASIWDHAPTADELLDARLASGWRPTATRTRGGEKILGHAARRSASN